MSKLNGKIKNILITILIILMCGIIFFYQTKKLGFHEDEMYTIASSVNPNNGLMWAYDDNNNLEWKSKETIKDFVTLTTNNYLNLKSVYINQSYDNHPPIFYALVHFSTMLFSGEFSKYSAFIVNIIAFALSCFIIKKILHILDKDNLAFPVLILYGLCMGTISMVLFQRMYMLLTLFTLLYFYLTLKIYKNNFEFDKKLIIQLGIATVCGFLTQYFFAIFAFFIFIIMIIEMMRNSEYKKMKIYTAFHILFAIIGVVLFTPCIKHLLFSDRGLSNLGNGSYFAHLLTYLKHLAYSFSINDNLIFTIIALALFSILVFFYCKKSEDKFIPIVTIIPSIFYFLINVKMTSFQELRYIMPIIPFVVFTFFFALDKLISIKYKDVIFIILSIVLVSIGMIFSKPKFLYENYGKCLNIAEENKEKSFVYVYDNFFNHMQSIPEMMIYEKTLIINTNNDELQNVINDEVLNNEDSYILCIKTYLNNDEIIKTLTENTNFKNVTKLFEGSDSSIDINNNLYLLEQK